MAAALTLRRNHFICRITTRAHSRQPRACTRFLPRSFNAIIDSLEKTIDRVGKTGSNVCIAESDGEHVDVRNHVICALVIILLLFILIRMNMDKTDD
jgi:hypothetical protein